MIKGLQIMLAAALIFACLPDLTAACPTRRSSCNSNTTVNTAPVVHGRRTESRVYRKQKSANSADKRTLRKIHSIQQDILRCAARNDGSKLTKLQNELQKQATNFNSDLTKISNFPFAEDIVTFKNVIDAISKGHIKIDYCKSQAPEKILKAIQEKQTKALNEYCRKALKDIRVIQ